MKKVFEWSIQKVFELMKVYESIRKYMKVNEN